MNIQEYIASTVQKFSNKTEPERGMIMSDFKIHEVDYKTAREGAEPLQGEPGTLPEGTWLPVSAASEYAQCSTQTVRLLYLAGQIRGLKFNKGPLLVDIRFLPSLIRKSELFKLS